MKEGPAPSSAEDVEMQHALCTDEVRRSSDLRSEFPVDGGSGTVNRWYDGFDDERDGGGGRVPDSKHGSCACQ